ncbi:MAG: CbrC family protein [Actinomycetaceae bacterium]|nr:CbrC family protein [Actinomycetaceae bacterium]
MTATDSLTEELPTFRYHPDPVGSGVFAQALDFICDCCEKPRQWRYKAGFYSVDEAEICPWCIADGSAYEKYDADFIDDFIDDDPEPSEESENEVRHRTPSYSSWQGEMWRTHCGEAMAFMGYVSWDDVKDNQELVDSFELDDVVQDMSVDGDLTGYLFQCLHCGMQLGYSDCS